MSNDTGVERTLVLLKPDAVARGLVGRILTRFDDALLKVVASKMVWMDADLARQHYLDLEDRFGPAVYGSVAAFMQAGPVSALVLEGAIFRVIRGFAEHGARHGFSQLTGEWPGEEAPEPKEINS